MPQTTALSSEQIKRQLSTHVIGQTIEIYQQLGSTNDLLKGRAQAGAAEGLVIIAEEQVSGRGRMQRTWIAPPGYNLLLSVLLRPALAATESFALTMLAAVALCEAVETATGVQAALKWPNDLLVADADGDLRKAAGILSEIELKNQQVVWAVIGMGINVNWSPSGVIDGKDLHTLATSLATAAGHIVDREALAVALLTQLDRRYSVLQRGERGELFAAWRTRLRTLGQPVTVNLPNGQLHGQAEDVDGDGALMVRDAAGQLHRVLAGDVV
jgi:BirA family biotin operon repressor/biotin-[acetyl-CoA-carboxylase] ligase